MNFSTLRTVSELADLGGETEALLAAFIPDVPGSFFRWYETLGEGVNITEFKYRMNPGVAIAQILFSVTVKNPREVADIQVRCHGFDPNRGYGQGSRLGFGLGGENSTYGSSQTGRCSVAGCASEGGDERTVLTRMASNVIRAHTDRPSW